MRIFVKVKPNAKRTAVVRLDNDRFKISVQEPPREGKANEAVVHALADHLKIAPSRIAIVSGGSERDKVFEI